MQFVINQIILKCVKMLETQMASGIMAKLNLICNIEIKPTLYHDKEHLQEQAKSKILNKYF